MAKTRTNEPFSVAVHRLLAQHKMRQRTLAISIGVDPGFLSRVLRGADYKTPSPELCRAVAGAFELPDDYFAEFRFAYVVDRIRQDARLRDRTYDRLRR